MELHQYFLSQITVAESGCWIWNGLKNNKGYGRIIYNRAILGSSHKYSFKHYVGSVPDRLYVCHECDNPSCCNPFHLFLGTSSQNALDAINKGRRPKALHGSMAMYCRPYRCRCEKCVESARIYFKNRPGRRKPIDITKSTVLS